MAELLTIQDSIDGRLDTQTLKEAVNEDKVIVSRLGKEYASVPMASRLLVENGLLGARGFSTYAKMTAPDVDPPLVNGDYAVVTNDEDTNKNGVYEKINDVWVYTKYNPVNKKISLTDGVLFAISDDEGNPTWLQVSDTDGGMTEQAESFVRDKLNILKTSESTVMFAVVDDNDNLTDLAVDTSGAILNEVLDNWAMRLKERGHLQSDTNKETKVQPDDYEPYMPTQVGTVSNICIGDKYYKDGAYYPVAPDKTKVIMIGSSSIRYSASFIRTALTALNKGITSYQPGFAGAVIEHMYPLVGNRPITVIPENNKINANGATTITLVDSPSIKGGLADFDGWLSGIHGNLSEVGTDMIFTRTTNAASDTTVNQAVPFIPELGNQYRNAIGIYWIGKNNLTSGNSLYNDVDQLIKGHDEMIEFSASMFKRFVVLTHYCDTDEPAVSEARDRINRCNDLYKQRYRDSVFDAEAIILGQQIFTDLGITKTAADDAAIAKRSLPPSLSKDAGHCTDAVYEYISNKLVEFMNNNQYFGA